MQILGQFGDRMVNLDAVHAITVYDLGKTFERRFRILAWYGSGSDDCWSLGDYATEDRAKQIIREMWEKYSSYMHREYSPAVLRGTVNI